MNPRNITLLRDLRVPEDVLTEKISVRSDYDGVYHNATTHCYHANVLQVSPAREVSLAEIQWENDCRCLNSDRVTGLNTWGLTSYLEDTVERTLARWDNQDLADVSLQYRFLENASMSFHATLQQVEPSLRERLQEAIELVSDKLTTARDQALAQLQSAGAREHFARAAPSSTRSLVGLEGERFHHDFRTPQEDALLLAYEVPHSQAVRQSRCSYRGVMPSSQARNVKQWANEVSPIEDHYCASVVLGDLDTPEVIETALALWDPHAGVSSPARFLADALEMARRL